MDNRPNASQPSNAQVAFKISESLSDEAVKRITRELDESGIPVAIIRMPKHIIYAATDWLVDGAISFLVMKELFGGFFKEAGKEAYIVVKDWMKRVSIDSRQIKVQVMSGSQSPQKLSSSYTQSRSITPHIQLKDGTIIKLLLDERLSNDDWETALEQMFDSVADHYENYPSDRLTEITKELTNKPRQRIYAIIDIELKDWAFYNDVMMMELSRNNQ